MNNQFQNTVLKLEQLIKNLELNTGRLHKPSPFEQGKIRRKKQQLKKNQKL